MMQFRCKRFDLYCCCVPRVPQANELFQEWNAEKQLKQYLTLLKMQEKGEEKNRFREREK